MDVYSRLLLDRIVFLGSAIDDQVANAIIAQFLFLESSMKLWDVWLAFYFVFSGYVLPLELFPRGLAGALDYLPFRYQLALPVELMTGAHGRAAALGLVLRQWLVVVIAFSVVALAWRRGLRRFAAYGG